MTQTVAYTLFQTLPQFTDLCNRDTDLFFSHFVATKKTGASLQIPRFYKGSMSTSTCSFYDDSYAIFFCACESTSYGAYASYHLAFRRSSVLKNVTYSFLSTA